MKPQTIEAANPTAIVGEQSSPIHARGDEESRRPTISTLLSITCLDAPLVATAWQGIFANSFRTPITNADRVVLFLTAWLIYLADRIADSFAIREGASLSARQKFCRKHRHVMIALIIVLASTDAICAFAFINRETFFCGAIVGLAIAVYLAVNHFAGFVWQKIPAKEIAIGFLFAFGTVAAIHRSDWKFLLATFLFGALCSLNCLSISVWERDLDLVQNKSSFATAHPDLFLLPFIVSCILAVVGIGLAISPDLRVLGTCITSAAVLLGILNRVDSLPRDDRVALADIVLLTPIVILFLRGVFSM